MRRRYRAAWLLWATAGASIEASALARHRHQGYTLSENFWAVEHRAPGTRYAVAAFFVWLTAHLLKINLPED